MARDERVTAGVVGREPTGHPSHALKRALGATEFYRLTVWGRHRACDRLTGADELPSGRGGLRVCAPAIAGWVDTAHRNASSGASVVRQQRFK